ncbi:MAG: hypothetical protein ACI83B_003367 [Sediminicola sp.]|jgi:hypothetical protein
MSLFSLCYLSIILSEQQTTGETQMLTITPKDNASNQKNQNKGTSGTNKQNSKAHGNRSKQIQQQKEK